MVGVKVRENESIDKALRRFKRVMNKSRVLRNYRETLAYEKPSITNRLARERAQLIARRRSEDNQL